jgi:hypothetical protein
MIRPWTVSNFETQHYSSYEILSELYKVVINDRLEEPNIAADKVFIPKGFKETSWLIVSFF